jgi:hypothetical protein
MSGEGIRPSALAYPRPMANDGGSSGSGSSGKAASRRKAPGTTGRVTPKGTQPRGAGSKGPGPRGTSPRARATGEHIPAASSRYTPPIPQSQKVSPRWVPIVMFALLGVGVAIIILNYLGVLPGGSDNLYLLVGLAAITGGFITATQYR